MQDIDFDELDRAVSSVMEPEPVQNPVQPQPLVAQPVPQPVPTPAAATLDTTASPAVRRGGRFMDVVHPSSDMRTVPARPEPSLPVAQPAPQPAAQTEAPALDSPFLADAKVEKRPLGAFSETQQAAPLDLAAAMDAALNDEVSSPEPIAQEPEVITPVADPEPVEELVGQPNPEDLAVLEVSEEKLLGIESEETVAEPVQPAAPVAVVPDPASLAPVSIPQQYREQPATDEQPSGAIYDTESYHQPLAHPPKKSSSWLIILWICGLLLLGGGVGALVYFFILPQL